MPQLAPSPSASPAPGAVDACALNDALPSLPPLRVPIFHQFLPWTVLYFLLPFLEDNLAPHPAAPPAAPGAIPRWTLWLERWYQVFHPATWVYLELDDNADKLKIDEIGILWRKAKAETGQHGERAMKLRALLLKLYERRNERFRCLYGLHVVRKIYLERKQKEHSTIWKSSDYPVSPKASEDEILRYLPDDATESLPPYEPGSVWPFSSPAPVQHSRDDPPPPLYSLQDPFPSKRPTRLPGFIAKPAAPSTANYKHFALPHRNIAEAMIKLAEAERANNKQPATQSAASAGNATCVKTMQGGGSHFSRRVPRQVAI